MRSNLFILLTVLMLALCACNSAATSTASQAEPASLPTPKSSNTEAISSKPTPTRMGGGSYWIASMNRETDGSFTVWITRPLEDAAPEIIYRSESGYVPRGLSWSPDGQYLAFTIYHGEDPLTQVFYLYDRASKEMRTFDLQQMTGKQGWVWQIDWSPDAASGQLAFSLQEGGMQNTTLWLADMRQGTASLVKDQNLYWSWEASGKAIILQELWKEPIRVNLQTLAEEKLSMPTRTQLSGGANRFRFYGYILSLKEFLVSRTGEDGKQSFFLISSDGSQERLLFEGDMALFSELAQLPYLSPDGKQIALNFSTVSHEPILLTGSLDQLPLKAPAAADPKHGLLLLWSPDSRIYASRISQQSDNGPFSLGFFDAASGAQLYTYQAQPPFSLEMAADFSSAGIDHSFYSSFDSIWMP
jgi:Tol biopolymer transport system component